MTKISYKLQHLFTLCLIVSFCFISCSDNSPEIIPPEPDKPSLIFKTGEDSILFNGYSPLSDKPIMIHYYIPKRENIKELPVLYSMHGAERSGKIQRDAWKYFAEAYGFIVLAPQYSKEYYLENDYQFAGIYESKNSPIIRDKANWTFNSIEAIFDFFKHETENKSQKYSIFGHSAGAQFIHRSLLAFPEARINTAVIANPGTWTFLLKEGIKGHDNITYGWPYSIKDTPFTEKGILESFFKKNIYVQIGTADTDLSGPNVPSDAPSIAQGIHRYERAINFYNHSENLALNQGLDFNFKLAEVKGVGHSTLRMVYGKNEVIRNNIEERGENSAFNLIFR